MDVTGSARAKVEVGRWKSSASAGSTVTTCSTDWEAEQHEHVEEVKRKGVSRIRSANPWACLFLKANWMDISFV